jgi:hypothetical protein
MDTLPDNLALPKTDAPLPNRAKCLKDIALPNVQNVIFEQADPKRAKDRRLMDDPQVILSSTETVPRFPNLAGPNMLTDDPSLANCLRDTVLPKFKKSTADTADPSLEKDRILKLLPIVRVVTIEVL